METAVDTKNNLIDRLRERGWRLSAQRRVVAEVLKGDHVHLTAEEILERAQDRLPEISQATVYNTLRDLVAMGEVRVVAADDGIRRYDPNVEVSHHHLLCLRCQTLKDVHPFGVEGVTLSDSERFGYELRGVDIVFKGLCPSCKMELATQ
jgi:Fe2+ or Zn2+ uptake regulation protein